MNNQTTNFKNAKDSVLEIEINEVELIAEGKNLREAYTNAFNDLKTQIYKKYNNFIVHLEPLDVIEIKDEANLETKRTFGLLPRKKINFTIALKIIFRVKYIKI